MDNSFSNMPGRVNEWPAWEEYPAHHDGKPVDSDYDNAHNAILKEYGPDALRQSWLKVCEELAKITDDIASKGSQTIPVVDTDSILRDGFTNDQLNDVKRVGALVCRATVPNSEATSLYSGLRSYLANNEGRIAAWPKESPSMFMLYDSPTQNALRGHPNHLLLQKRLLDLWTDSTGETSFDPLVYLDGVRDRAPGQIFLGLGPHIDAGSLSRWADPCYRRAYDNIFSGHPEKYDAYDLSVRKDAKQDLFAGVAHSSVFRSFQGWTALTPTERNKGTILIYPNVSWAIAYVLLRPFFSPPASGDEIMDASKWTLNEGKPWFPGTLKPESQRLSRTSHPHLRLEECLVAMPPLEPGDTVWWHTDVSISRTILSLVTDFGTCRCVTLLTQGMTAVKMRLSLTLQHAQRRPQTSSMSRTSLRRFLTVADLVTTIQMMRCWMNGRLKVTSVSRTLVQRLGKLGASTCRSSISMYVVFPDKLVDKKDVFYA